MPRHSDVRGPTGNRHVIDTETGKLGHSAPSPLQQSPDHIGPDKLKHRERERVALVGLALFIKTGDVQLSERIVTSAQLILSDCVVDDRLHDIEFPFHPGWSETVKVEKVVPYLTRILTGDLVNVRGLPEGLLQAGNHTFDTLGLLLHLKSATRYLVLQIKLHSVTK